MRHSESLGKLATALVAAQAELDHAHKNAVNPHFKNKYADLTEVLDTVLPVLNKHGLTVTQIPGFEGGIVTLDTMILHTSGEFITGTSGSPVTKNDPQGVGSATTYLRRYSLAALAGIGQEDDDGNAASRHTNGNGAAAKAVEKVGATQCATLLDMIESTDTDKGRFLAHYGIQKVADLPAAKYDEAMANLEKKQRTVPA